MPEHSLTSLVLFLAAVILVEESDHERSRSPIQLERFRLASAVQIAALIVLGPGPERPRALSSADPGSRWRCRSAATTAR
jgi:hypothetical protein